MGDRTSIERPHTRGTWSTWVLLACAGSLSSACTWEADAPWPFGFEAYYELPRVRPDEPGILQCGTDNGGPTTSPWVDGPHDRFAELGPAMLARDSLRWFEHSMQSGAWRGNPTARIELTYPSGALAVTVRQDAASGLAWEQQLGAWFERFPPGGEGPWCESDRGYSWDVEYAGRGEIYGRAASDGEAVESMRYLYEACVASSLFDRPTFSLTYFERRSSHEMDSYSVGVSDVEELEELPQRLREKYAQLAWHRAD